jgi:aminopeptidase N
MSKRNWRRLRTLFVLVAALFLSATLTSAQRRERVVDTWKPLHYDISLSFNDQLSEITSARTEITAQVLKDNVSAIDLDFGSLPIEAVKLGAQPARFERGPDVLKVFLGRTARIGEKFSILVSYHGRPTDGLIFDTDRDGNPSVTGDNWPNRVHHWIPCLDHPSAKATVTFVINAPSRDVVVANGKPRTLNQPPLPSARIFEETKPIPAYCMVIAISQGVKINSADKTATPLSFYVPKKDSAYAPKGFSSADEAIAFFSETVAPYPYEKLALIVGATRFGGMENSSAIVFTNNLFDPRAHEKMSPRFGIPTRIENLVAHEIAHQWFGDSVTEATWADLWLSEGFATYFAGLFIEKHEGDAAFRDYMRDAAARYFAYEKQRNAPIYDDSSELTKLLNENNYEKGAWVLHMLRRRLGDEAFFRGLRNYYNKHREANASTEDLRAALEKASGKDLRDFFKRWIYGSGHPIYEWSSAAAELTGGEQLVTVTLTQKQAGDIFLDPVPVEITSGGQRKLITLQPKERVVTAQIRVSGLPISIQVDPAGTLLKEVVAGQMEN